MPLDFQEIEIPLAAGLDQKTARLLRTPGVLRTAENVDYRQAGMIRKRRGYERIDLDAGSEVQGNLPDLVMFGAATLRDELVLFGAEYLWAVADRSAQLDASSSLVRRGPVLRGHVSMHHVVSSSHGTAV